MKDLLTSLRASNETYNSMKYSARAIIRRAEIPLLAVIVLYKAATNLLFVPLMQHSKCTVRTLGSNVTIQMVGSVFVLYCEIPTR